MPIAVFTVATVFDLAETPDDALVVDVIGQQWWWEFGYPDQGIVTANEIVIPTGQPVQVRISSRDVIHSFWIPALNGKRDAVPGRVTSITLEADNPGEYWGQCTEFCGLSHANMRIRAVALVARRLRRVGREPAERRGHPRRGNARGRRARGVHEPRLRGLPRGARPRRSRRRPARRGRGAEPHPPHDAARRSPARPSSSSPPTATSPPPGPTGTPVECLNRSNLEAWLRDPEALVPMAPDEGRGMPNLGLTEAEIDSLVDYLSTLS